MKKNQFIGILLFTVVVIGHVACDEKDLYKVLGVSKTATEKELKKAFRRLSIQWHPDRHQDNKKEAQKKFIEIANAYEILKDPKKRAEYDQGGDNFNFDDTFANKHSHEDFDKMFRDFIKGFDDDDFFSSYNFMGEMDIDEDAFGNGGGSSVSVSTST